MHSLSLVHLLATGLMSCAVAGSHNPTAASLSTRYVFSMLAAAAPIIGVPVGLDTGAVDTSAVAAREESRDPERLAAMVARSPVPEIKARAGVADLTAALLAVQGGKKAAAAPATAAVAVPTTPATPAAAAAAPVQAAPVQQAAPAAAPKNAKWKRDLSFHMTRHATKKRQSTV